MGTVQKAASKIPTLVRTGKTLLLMELEQSPESTWTGIPAGQGRRLFLSGENVAVYDVEACECLQATNEVSAPGSHAAGGLLYPACLYPSPRFQTINPFNRPTDIITGNRSVLYVDIHCFCAMAAVFGSLETAALHLRDMGSGVYW